MVEWLAIWGVAAVSVFRPILEDIAKDVAKDAAKSYVGQCFKGVFSVIYKEPLTKATGQALKELLELIEDELIRADIEEERIKGWIPDVKQFLYQEPVRDAIAGLFLQADYYLDPAVFMTAWQQLDHAISMPDEFSWPYVAKRFSTKAVAIRDSSPKIQEAFASLAQAQNTEALQELAGLPPEFDLETYREALVERYGTVDLASLDTTGAYYEVRLWSVFVAQSVRECHEYDPQLLEVPKDQLLRLVEAGELDAAQLAESEKLHDERRRAYVNQSPKPVLEVTDEVAIPRQVILGDPGSGKSSLLRYLALQWARINDANQRYTQPLPLLIELREYARWHCPSHKGFLKYLHEASTWHRLNQQTLKHLLEQPNRVVLLLDGLDEVFDPAEREQVVNDIHRFSNEYKQVRMVVTSRVVGYQPHRLRNAEFRHFMLQDLDDDQIGTFLDRWHEVTFDKSQQTEAESKRDRLDKAIKHSKSIRQLAGNPLLLTMMAVLNRHQELPRDRVDLYQQCSRLLLHQWDTERALGDFPGLSAEIGLREKTEILRVVAYAMQTRVSDESRANYIDGDTLTKLIEDYLCTELRFDQARAVARALVEQLRTRNFILCDLGANSYAFVHRTFLEYFCAAEIVHQFNARILNEQQLITLFDTYCLDDDWHEVLRLTCGQINEAFVANIIEYLLARIDLDNWDCSSMLPEVPLAIGCLSEVRNLSQLEAAGANVLLIAANCFLQGDFIRRGSSLSFITDLLAASAELGKRWPGKSAFEFSGQYPTSREYHHHRLWPHFLNIVFEEREWITQLASCNGWDVRRGSLQALAEKWPDETTRTFLTQQAVDDPHEDPRSAALQALAEKWPDATTRTFLTQRALDDEHADTRRAALQALAEKWPDATTRTFLTQRALDDQHADTRRAALQALAKTWPEETTRTFLTQRAVDDQHASLRRAALQALAETWPEETTRTFLTQRAVDDEYEYTRSAALQALAETWPEETTRTFLTQRAVDDEYEYTRSAALQALAETWPEETTRTFLTQRAVDDEHEHPRSAALQALAETWPEETTRTFLTQRAVDDEHEHPRSAAVQALAEKWPEESHDLLLQRVLQDPDASPRGAAWTALGKLHSEFGRLLPTRDLDGFMPYLDPLEPVSQEHIEKAAKKAGIPPEEIDAQVAALSAYFGWDITVGASAANTVSAPPEQENS
jgi:HEAT repeat protein